MQDEIFFSSLQLCMNMPQQALTLLEGVLVIVICNGSLLDRAKAQYLWIRCTVAAANKMGREHKLKGIKGSVKIDRSFCRNLKRFFCFVKNIALYLFLIPLFLFLSAIKDAVEILEDVIRWCRKLEAHSRTKDVIYYQARLYNELGAVPERNECALEFRLLDEQYPTWNKTSVHIL